MDSEKLTVRRSGKMTDAQKHDLLHYWSEKWGVTDEQVKQAIRKVGPMVKDVARELGRA
jgi:hypothetical protein